MRLISSWKGSKRVLVRPEDVVFELGCRIEQAHVMLHRLVKKGWLTRIRKGTYMLPPEHPFLILPELIDSYYVGYLTALNFHGLTDQVPTAVFVVTPFKTRNFSVMGHSFQFVHITERKFFGIARHELFGRKVMISDLEKTLLDAVDKPQYSLGMRNARGYFQKARGAIDVEKLVSYALRMGSRVLIRRVGVLLDLSKIKIPKGLERRMLDRSREVSYFTPFDPTGKKIGDTVAKWRIILNG
ncbi:MAG: type IV toxin-antitoxin system AbiEi family antitoxin domain-containing protein [Candidatus Hodarchaeaceae archaeon]|nr:type IV toxin-antitoxin system AbiEi family antitoxin domain-containing protein [Candidatus Hodarchaeaceae archaeon]